MQLADEMRIRKAFGEAFGNFRTRIYRGRNDR